jgi:sulfate adenylyltransferase subunit 1 (EFTu-like GTPase family)
MVRNLRPVGTLHREEAAQPGLSDIGRVEVAISAPLCFDAYQENRATGSFIHGRSLHPLHRGRRG